MLRNRLENVLPLHNSVRVYGCETEFKIEESWKMKRFADVPPRVKVAKVDTKKEVENAIKKELEAKKLLEGKHYIKRNF